MIGMARRADKISGHIDPTGHGRGSGEWILMRAFVVSLGLTFLAAITASAQPPADLRPAQTRTAHARTDPWEGRPLSREQMASCRSVPDKLVVPVGAEQRQAAIGLLASTQIVQLTLEQAANLLGKSPSDFIEFSSTSKPYLIGAVATYENAGRFRATVCGDALDVVHGSLGSGAVKKLWHVPIVVFLESQPARVRSEWHMAA